MMKAHFPMQPAGRQRPGSYASLKATQPQPVWDPKHDSQDDGQQAGPPVHVLSHDEAVALFGEQTVQAPRTTPFSIVFGQAAITLLRGPGWYVGSQFTKAGTALAAETGLSALLGDGVCVVPSAWFAMRLLTVRGSESTVRLVMGKAIKVLGAVALLVVVVVVFKGLHWPSLLITLILALKVY